MHQWRFALQFFFTGCSQKSYESQFFQPEILPYRKLYALLCIKYDWIIDCKTSHVLLGEPSYKLQLCAVFSPRYIRNQKMKQKLAASRIWTRAPLVTVIYSTNELSRISYLLPPICSLYHAMQELQGHIHTMIGHYTITTSCIEWSDWVLIYCMS